MFPYFIMSQVNFNSLIVCTCTFFYCAKNRTKEEIKASNSKVVNV